MNVGGGAGPLGGQPAPGGLVAGDVELVVVQGRGGAPVAGDGAAAGGGGGGPLAAGASGCAFVPPGVVERGDRVAEPRVDGRGLAAGEFLDGLLAGSGRAGDPGRAVAHHVQGAQPQPDAARVHAARTGAACGELDRRGDGGRLAAAASDVVHRRWLDPGGCGDCPAGAALPQLGQMVVGGAAPADGIDGVVVTAGGHVSSPPRPGGHAGRGGSGRSCGRSPGSAGFPVPRGRLAGLPRPVG
jgi:hypothetical protein